MLQDVSDLFLKMCQAKYKNIHCTVYTFYKLIMINVCGSHNMQNDAFNNRSLYRAQYKDLPIIIIGELPSLY